MQDDMLTDILRLHNRGLALFPVDVQTKIPLVSGYHGLNAIRADEHKIREWFEGKNHAVGIACGPISNILLLDFDFAKHPEARQFYEDNQFPRTWVEQTKSGGLHIYFKWCDELNDLQTNTTSKFWKGVDTKGYGGYSKVAPSDGYEWIVAPHMAPLADVPQWLLEKFEKREKPVTEIVAKPEDWMITDLLNIDAADPIKGRTPTFVRVINGLKSRGLNQSLIAGFLKPWADLHEYTDRLEGLVDDQFRRYPPKPAQVQDGTLSSFLDTDEQVDWFVDGMIPTQSIGFMAGLPEACKTWLLMDLGIEVARGGMWLNKFPTKQGKVLYIDQERPALETRRRFRSLLNHKGARIAEIENNLTIRCWSGNRVHLNVPQSFERFDRMLTEEKPNIVLIDSFKTIHTSNELSTQDMQTIMQKLNELRAKHGCSFFFIHHETKGVHQRRKEGAEVTYLDASGTIDLAQTAEIFFNVVGRGECESMVHHTKNNYGRKMAPFLVKVIDKTPDKKNISVEAF